LHSTENIQKYSEFVTVGNTPNKSSGINARAVQWVLPPKFSLTRTKDRSLTCCLFSTVQRSRCVGDQRAARLLHFLPVRSTQRDHRRQKLRPVAAVGGRPRKVLVPLVPGAFYAFTCGSHFCYYTDTKLCGQVLKIVEFWKETRVAADCKNARHVYCKLLPLWTAQSYSRKLFSFQHSSTAIVKGAGLVMKAIIEEADSETAANMQKLALSEVSTGQTEEFIAWLICFKPDSDLWPSVTRYRSGFFPSMCLVRSRDI